MPSQNCTERGQHDCMQQLNNWKKNTWLKLFLIQLCPRNKQKYKLTYQMLALQKTVINLIVNIEVKLTVKSTDPTMVARATTYSGNVARIVQVVWELGGAVLAEH